MHFPTHTCPSNKQLSSIDAQAVATSRSKITTRGSLPTALLSAKRRRYDLPLHLLGRFLPQSGFLHVVSKSHGNGMYTCPLVKDDHWGLHPVDR